MALRGRGIDFAETELIGQDSGASAPTDGTWAKGWVRWNTTPVAGGNAGWICITAGTPGEWKEFGLISL